jgi:hypothetical protein
VSVNCHRDGARLNRPRSDVRDAMGAPQNVGKLVCVLRPRVRGEESGNVCLGSKTDVAAPICDVCFSPQQQTLIGHACTSALDLGCVKTCPREQRAELFSLLSILDSAHQHCYFFNLQKSRQTFYPQIQFRSFHTAKTNSGLIGSFRGRAGLSLRSPWLCPDTVPKL